MNQIQSPGVISFALKKDFDAGLKTNSFWISSILNAAKYNQNIEKLTYLNSIIDSITLREIAKLAKQLFDENYFESADFIARGVRRALLRLCCSAGITCRLASTVTMHPGPRLSRTSQAADLPTTQVSVD